MAGGFDSDRRRMEERSNVSTAAGEPHCVIEPSRRLGGEQEQ
jgi:hypothetical protein